MPSSLACSPEAQGDAPQQEGAQGNFLGGLKLPEILLILLLWMFVPNAVPKWHSVYLLGNGPTNKQHGVTSEPFSSRSSTTFCRES